ncbi:mechanosensitive ion channel family protein [Bacillus methanolicus PB1]|uniref:Mechanosensitive ion channel family protein n=1 Tax=Bacillus methanolicus PB1 TaxID=997296 RepID=I3E0Y8_BACMT|nr:mechanosensitive ion channel family protein [Bacillus methanolicus]EIJ80159.1 mechanosensitive ion channel family protein [Bacillus methanolicus PB1]
MQEMFNNLKEKFLNEDTWIAFGAGLLKIMAIMILSAIVLRIGKLIIKNIFLVRAKAPLRFSERREATLKKLLENILTYVVYFIAIITILSTLTIEVKPLLAGAGIVGLAVGFGAQSLVKDIISGFFIIFEDQFSVGDHIRVGQFEGTVEEIGLRTTKIKNWTGELHIIPNGSITEVTNFSLYNSVAVVDVSIAYNEDIERAEKVIQEFLKDLPDQYEDIVNPPELLGVQNLGTSEVVLRIVAETLPMRHFNIARMLRREIKVLLEAHGFDIPFPRLVMYSRSDEQEAQKQLGKE